MRHCDDIADDPATLDCVRAFVNHARAPAHGALLETPCPKLFASHNGKRVQVVMASRLGDVGITQNMRTGASYSQRVMLDELTDFSDQQ